MRILRTMPSTHKWIGFFIPLDVLTRVRAYIAEETFMSFDVQDDDRLNYTHSENDLFSFCLQNEVRVVGNDGSNWCFDLDPQKLNILWRFWIMEMTPIFRLTWDEENFIRKCHFKIR